MDVTNNSKAPQGIHTMDGLTYVMPGETKSVRLNETLFSHAKALDFFDLEGEAEADELGKAETLVADTSELDRVKAENVSLLKRVAELDAELGKLKAAKPEETPKTATEVLAMATNADVPFMTFKAAATKLLGDKTPSKKDEIISALEELATKP